MSFILGLTGGIASGKSTVVDFFKDEGFPIVDGDLIARKVVEPGMPALAAIVKVFGEGILQDDRSLDRKALGRVIFDDPAKRQLLDQTLDPYLRAAIQKEIMEKSATADLVIADIPLLYEADYVEQMDEIAVVYLPYEIQLERLKIRDQLSEADAVKRIASQLSLEEKRVLADVIFDNQGSKAETKAQVALWLKQKGFQ